ncbi:MAG: DUF559 domain-containing protein [Bacteroidota bacterium]|nr:DUF559 domain-containing protein [Bacteroidota bacterium]
MSQSHFTLDSHKSRNTFSLNGVWEVTGGDKSAIPLTFFSTVNVPAVVDMAVPAYNWEKFDFHWYRTSFVIEKLSHVNSVFLKIEQSMFGTEVWLNGHHLGGSISCYTSHEYLLNEFLNPEGKNELIVRVGAKSTLPPESAVGRDQEKEIYTPGIWGDVSLVCVGGARVKLVQVIPHIETSTAEVRAWIESLECKHESLLVSAKIVEKRSRETVSTIQNLSISINEHSTEQVTFHFPIQNMQLWSHDYPFLYEVEISIKRPSPTPSQREGVFGYQTADPMIYPLLEEFAKDHRKNPTKAELVLWEHLKSKSLENYKFRRQHIIRRYIADFVCLSKNLVVEIDGLIHQLPENNEADEIRTQWLEEHGYKVIRFRNEDVVNDLDAVLSKILQTLKILPIGEDLGGAIFGMREFKIVGSDFYLNGKKILLRGSNIAFHRFLSDTQRKLLPWNEVWIKKALIEIPKEHHFNFFRNHLGQMYNRWYDIADDYGMLIQNEWQFWGATGSNVQIRKEFTEWMHDNWNHPSIIIWDALNESSDDTVQQEVVPEMKKLDPTRPWESVDFLEEHPYIYSLGMVLNNRKLGFARSLDEIENLSVPSMVNEFLWWWFNDKWEPTVLTKMIVERWMGKNYTKEDVIAHQSFLAQELIELFRRLRIKAIQPFVYISNNDGPTAHWFLGDIKDLQPKPLLKAIKNAFAPFGVSIELWDRHFFVNEKRAIRFFIFNDTNETRRGNLAVGVKSQDGKWISKKEISVEVQTMSDLVITKEIYFPDKVGNYNVYAELIEDSSIVATSSKTAYLFEKPALPRIGQKIILFDSSKEIEEYLSDSGIAFLQFTHEKLENVTTLIVNGNVLGNQQFIQRRNAISQLVKNGGTLVLIEPEFRVVGSEMHTIVDGIDLKINQRADLEKGGYDSYVFAEDQSHPLWRDIQKEYLKFFNGAYGGEIVSQYDVDFSIPSKRLASCGLDLNVVAASEVEYGKGKIILFRLQLRGRLNGTSTSDSLYARRVDPIAQQLLLNVLEYALLK